MKLYGRDMVARIESAGLRPRAATHDEVLADIDLSRFGVNEKEPFLMFELPISPRV